MTGVTALVCTKDRPHLLGPCLHSLLASLSMDDELLLVEAPDPRSGGSDIQIDDPRFKRVVADRAGKSHQLNIGIGAARGSVIVLTDDDVRVPHDWVEAMVAPLGDPAVGLACGRVQGLSAVPGSAAPAPVAAAEAPLETWMFAHGAAMAVRKEAAFAAGGFDERLGPGAGAVGEDHDFLLRVREGDWKVHVSAAPVAMHEGWRTPEADRANALTYERGAGAILGAAIRRRAPQRWRLVRRRLSYQRRLLIDHRGFGARGLVAFAGGLLYGLRLKPQTFLNPAGPGRTP